MYVTWALLRYRIKFKKPNEYYINVYVSFDAFFELIDIVTV